MPAQVGSTQRYHDEVGGPGRDLLLAAGAGVGLGGLGRVYASDLNSLVLLTCGQVDHVLQFAHAVVGAVCWRPAVPASASGPGHAAKLPRAARGYADGYGQSWRCRLKVPVTGPG
jgi:hypothetical protein